MTVDELIRLLEEYPGEMPVVVEADHWSAADFFPLGAPHLVQVTAVGRGYILVAVKDVAFSKRPVIEALAL